MLNSIEKFRCDKLAVFTFRCCHSFFVIINDQHKSEFPRIPLKCNNASTHIYLYYHIHQMWEILDLNQ